MAAGYQDFRVGLRAVDQGEKATTEIWTPWASENPGDVAGMKTPWTDWVTNAAKHDPDGLSIGLETKWNGPVQLRDFRVAIGVMDQGEKIWRQPVVTPWLSEILQRIPKPPHAIPELWSGWSPLVGDTDNYDPDYFRLGLLMHPTRNIPGEVGFHMGISVADSPGQGQALNSFGEWRHAFALHGHQIWSPIAYDGDKYDFDRVGIAIAVSLYKPNQPLQPKPSNNPAIWPGNPW